MFFYFFPQAPAWSQSGTTAAQDRQITCTAAPQWDKQGDERVYDGQTVVVGRLRSRFWKR